jgi:hypothetical protein
LRAWVQTKEKLCVLACKSKKGEIDMYPRLVFDLNKVKQNLDTISIMDVTPSKKEYKVGDVISFTLGYGGLLKATTSSYVNRTYIGD